MSMSLYSKKALGRAAAILTTGEVAGATFPLHNAKNRQVTVDLSFTLGMLTNVIVRAYGSQDGSTWDPISVNGEDVLTETLTANTERMYVMPSLEGVKFFRVTVQGTGTVTSSSAAFDYLYTQSGGR